MPYKESGVEKAQVEFLSANLICLEKCLRILITI